MITPERPNLAPYIGANDYLINSTAKIWDEMDIIRLRGQSIHVTFDQLPDTPPFWNTITDPRFNQIRKKDMRKLKKLEEDFQTFNQAFDALVHGGNPSPVIRLLENQAEDLRTHSAGDENTEKIQDLKRLAADLSDAA